MSLKDSYIGIIDDTTYLTYRWKIKGVIFSLCMKPKSEGIKPSLWITNKNIPLDQKWITIIDAYVRYDFLKIQSFKI